MDLRTVQTDKLLSEVERRAREKAGRDIQGILEAWTAMGEHIVVLRELSSVHAGTADIARFKRRLNDLLFSMDIFNNEVTALIRKED